MFGTNTITGKSFFKDADDKLLVTSMFLTLQGEGPYQGRPALFIRLTYCNLDCSFCDTFFDQGDWYTIRELLEEAQEKILSRYKTLARCGIVITGGEPSLQPNINEFLLRCNAAGVAFTQVESNGILSMDLPALTTLVVSPKCSEKTSNYIVPHQLSLNKAFCLKFVLSADPNSPYHAIPKWAFEWQIERDYNSIYISPMNIYKPEMLLAARKRAEERKQHSIDYRSTVDEVVSGWDDTILDREQNRKNHEYAFKYCEDNGLFLTLQMHLFGSAA